MVKRTLSIIVIFFLAISTIIPQDEEKPSEKEVKAPDSLKQIKSAKKQEEKESKIPSFYTEENMYKFANYLYNINEYQRALIEYHRFNFTYPESELKHKTMFRIGLSYEKLSEYQRARKNYRNLIKKSRNPEINQICRYRMAATYYSSQQWDSTLSYLGKLEKDMDTDIAGAFEYLRGWCYLQETKYKPAMEIFKKLEEKESSEKASPSLHFLISKARQGRILPQKSPVISGGLSTVFPGAGQAYCERWGDAAFSSFFTLGSLGSAYYLWEKDKSFAISTAALGAFFYLGNIYGAITSAQIFNKNKREAFIHETELGVPHKPTKLYQELE